MGEGRERGAQAHYSPNLRPEKYPHHFPITTTPHSEVRIVRATPLLDPTAKTRPPDIFLFWEAESNGPLLDYNVSCAGGWALPGFPFLPLR